jgi:nicotinamidase/pyrazinamidase
VLNSVRDAVAEGFQATVLRDAIAAVDLNPEDGSRAEAEMRSLGARFVTLGDFEDECRQSAPH